ncbi:hypothetical protein [Pelagibius sp. Alg239-R121]|uniref:hypothetical protein n=1 Tax=Pelagibius sp. Alg239-R121 TaxID=2993448 RepID=UPI0024A63B93|nr:hypothetical protein [Pelagibius sp. Alg239-R121]
MSGVSGATAQSNRSQSLELPVLAQVGPWPVISQMTLFQGKLWFTNSVKHVDHNSAEIYSFDPAMETTRYERHLWSQDAGNPFVDEGLLYWPSEDPRISPGWGDFQVTNGVDWASGQITTARMFHVFAMAKLGNELVAATSAWRAGLQASRDQGKTWRETYDHPTPDQRVSRIIDLVEIQGLLIGHLKGPEGRKLIRFDGTSVSDLPGWPQNVAMSEVVRHGQHVYGLIQTQQGAAVWRSDGTMSEVVAEPVAGWHPFDLASDGDRLWAISDSDDGSRLWRSDSAVEWSLAGTLKGGEAYDVVAAQNAVYVGGKGADGRGILWGLIEHSGKPAISRTTQLPNLRPRARLPVTDWPAQAKALDQALAAPQSYEVRGRPIRDLAYVAATSLPPADFFNQRLKVPRPEGRMNPFRDVVIDPVGDIGASTILWAMGLSGEGRVPPTLVAAPWTKAENGAAKYFDPQPTAIWAVAELGQQDSATIDALMSRLDQPDDPLWLKGDVVGALTVLTGHRFGFDLEAWQNWWHDARPAWPES